MGFFICIDNCDLNRAVFDNSILEKADFRTSLNYSIDPELNRIKKAKILDTWSYRTARSV